MDNGYNKVIVIKNWHKICIYNYQNLELFNYIITIHQSRVVDCNFSNPVIVQCLRFWILRLRLDVVISNCLAGWLTTGRKIYVSLYVSAHYSAFFVFLIALFSEYAEDKMYSCCNVVVVELNAG